MICEPIFEDPNSLFYCFNALKRGALQAIEYRTSSWR